MASLWASRSRRCWRWRCCGRSAGYLLWAMLGVAAFVLLGLLVERLVVTDRKAGGDDARRRRGRREGQRSEPPAGLHFSHGEEARDYARLVLGRVEVEDAHIHDLEITINRLTSPRTAKAKFLAVGKGRDRKNEFPYQGFARRVVVELRREGGRWLVTDFDGGGLRSAATMRYLLNAAILIGLAAYVAAFYITPLPDFRNDDRPAAVAHRVARAACCCGPTSGCCRIGSARRRSSRLADRLPVLLVAGLILAWAAALGWLLMAASATLWRRRLACADQGRRDACTVGAGRCLPLQLTRLETFVFVAGRGTRAAEHLGAAAGAVRAAGADVDFRRAGDRDLLAAAGVCYRRRQTRPIAGG